MSKEMERVEKFEREVGKLDTFIQASTSFIYDHIEDPSTQELVECTRAVVYCNLNYLARKEETVEKLRQTMATVAPITASIVEPSLPVAKDKVSPKQHKNIQELIDLVTYSYLDEETMRILETQSHIDIVRIKLHFLRLIIQTKQAIKESVISNPQANISELQSDLDTYTLIVETISELEKKDQIVEVEEDKPYSNIILAPNEHRSTYILEDISEFPDKSKEIKLIMDKVIDGYFLKTKDTRGIEGYQENLYEYKHPNGIRVLYVVEGNIIIVCSLFMKDKQKSSRIANEYDEAITRYYKVRNYIIENFNNPDFHIAQQELVGEVYELLDGPTLSKKVGDE